MMRNSPSCGSFRARAARPSLFSRWLWLIVLSNLCQLSGAALAQTVADPEIVLTKHVGGLAHPTGMRFLGDRTDDFFVIEKDTGRVKRILAGQSSTVLDLAVNYISERGLAGIELDPQFATNGYAYLFYCASSTDGDSPNLGEWAGNRLSRFTWNGSELTDETPLLVVLPDAGQANRDVHNGGPLVFGPDGMLYGVAGDLTRDRAEQNNLARSTVSSSGGGIYRIRPDGSLPDDNPFMTETNSAFHQWYAYGVRNSFGLAFDPVTGFLWDTENGEAEYDEVNVVPAGFNSGWSGIMGPSSRIASGVELVELEGARYADPKFSWLSTIGVTSIGFFAESQFDSRYRDYVLIGGVRSKLYMLPLTQGRDGFQFESEGLADLVADTPEEVAEITFGSGFGITADIRTGPDGALYITSFTKGEIYRLALPSPWLNGADAMDVNGDGVVEPLDALAIVNDLNKLGPRILSGAFRLSEAPPPYLDVSGDYFIGPRDALLIVDHLNVASVQATSVAVSAMARVPEPSGFCLMGSALIAPLAGVFVRRSRQAAWLIMLLLGGWANVASAQTVSDARLTLTTHATGFSIPTGMRFLGNAADDFFVIEKDTGRVQRWKAGAVSNVLDLSVNFNSERGLLGIELDPDFADNKQVYLYYSLNNAAGDSDVPNRWIENRVSRFTWNGLSLVGETPLLTFPTDPAQTNGPNHDGGPMLFGPDGNLYGVVGDMNRSRAEQNNTAQAAVSATSGGIYRIDSEGDNPADNPFVSNANADFHRWFAYGVRNSFGLAFDPVTNRLWDTENGPESFDEINLVQSGFNSGWTKIMGPDARDTNSVADLVMLPGAHYSDPEFSFVSPIGITSLGFLADTKLDLFYRDSVIFGAVDDKLYRLQLNEARDGFVTSGGLADLVADTVGEAAQIVIGSGFGVTTDIREGPDGAIYITSLSSGAVYRLTAATPWQNSDDPLDVDGNTAVEPLDALKIVDDLNENGPRILPLPTAGNAPPPFIDVDGNNVSAPLDALLIIDHLNDLSGASRNAVELASIAASVPEPGALILLVEGAIVLAMCWRGRRVAKR